MLAIKNKIMLWKFNKLVKKRNEEFVKGNYEKATYYGKMVDRYIVEVLEV